MKKEYYITNNNKEHLLELGFRYQGDGIYVYSFAGYKWRGFTTIICKITAFDDKKDISVDAYSENGNIYAPFYSDDKNSQVLAIIKSNIKREFIRCGILRKV